MRRARWIVALSALLLLPSCVDLDGADWVIDLAAHSATAVFENFRGSSDSDLKDFQDHILKEDSLTSNLTAHVTSKDVVVDGERLNLRVNVTFERPADLGIGLWDANAPYRLCPQDDMVFTAANADWRDADGCLIWRTGAQTLRFHVAPRKHSLQPSLLSRYQEWVAHGRPELK
jgi:hypothetical protein